MGSVSGRGPVGSQESKTEAWGTSAMFEDSEGNLILISSRRHARAGRACLTIAYALRCLLTRAVISNIET